MFCTTGQKRSRSRNIARDGRDDPPRRVGNRAGGGKNSTCGGDEADVRVPHGFGIIHDKRTGYAISWAARRAVNRRIIRAAEWAFILIALVFFNMSRRVRSRNSSPDASVSYAAVRTRERPTGAKFPTRLSTIAFLGKKAVFYPAELLASIVLRMPIERPGNDRGRLAIRAFWPLSRFLMYEVLSASSQRISRPS